MTLMVVSTVLCFYLVFLLEMSKEKVSLTNQKITSSQQNVMAYSKFIWLVLALILTFVSSFRFGFVDTSTYRMLFDTSKDKLNQLFQEGFSLNGEYGFVLFMEALKRIYPHSQILLVASSTIIVLGSCYLIQKYSVDLGFSILIFFFLIFLDSMNGVRQMMIVILFMLCFPFIKKRQFFLYAFCIGLLSSFHITALLCLPLYFFIHKKVFNIWMKGIVLFSLLVFVNFSWLEVIVQLLFGEESKYMSYFNQNIHGMNPMRLLVSIAPVILMVIYECWKKKYSLQEPENQRFLYQVLGNMAIINVCCNLLGLKLVYLTRLGTYFEFVPVLLIPYIVYQILQPKEYNLTKYGILLLYFIFFSYQLWSFQQSGLLQDLRLIF